MFSCPKVDFGDSAAIDHYCFASNWFAAITFATGVTPVTEGLLSGQESIAAKRCTANLSENSVVASFDLMSSAAADSGHHSFSLQQIDCAAATD